MNGLRERERSYENEPEHEPDDEPVYEPVNAPRLTGTVCACPPRRSALTEAAVHAGANRVPVLDLP